MDIQQTLFTQIMQLVQNSSRISIVTHINPDGDAIGSSLAWAGVLRQLNKAVTVITPNNCPDNLQWMQGYSEILKFDTQKQEVLDCLLHTELFFCLDFNNLSRLEELGESILKSTAPHVLIDHHPNPECFAKVAISVTEASSTSELVYHTIIGCGYEQYLNTQIAESLYTGIITDTGGLSHNSGRPELYHIIAHLLQKGINKTAIHDIIFNVFSYDRMKLLGTILKDNFVFMPEYKTAYMYITIENQKLHNFQLGDSEGFVNYPLAIKDVVFCALFTEYENNTTKVSFRSKRQFPANEFSAKYFNGGGHLNAAGGRRACSLHDAINAFENGLHSFKELLLKS
ncbi:MAG TPA: bifunctional oligoribonuclease/PAP phosphatase NrnA [Bacteroidales bacterium]|nr:bifunctional oligoribonuclease/PAP phosphatase NrnA [Bacteroidales bacterium]